MKIAFWISGLKDPSPRFRFLQFIEPLRKKGHAVDVYTLKPERYKKIHGKNKIVQNAQSAIYLAARSIQLLYFCLFKAKKYDIIFTNKDILPNINITWVEKLMHGFNKNLVFDIDDAIYLGERGKKLPKIMPYYKAVIAGSPVLQEFTSKHYNVKSYYIPMAINTQMYKPAETRTPGKLRIGWSGSHYTNVYALPLLKEPIEALAKVLDFEFIVISNKDPQINWNGVNHRFILWTSETEVQGLQQFDIGLMPLKDEPFERGKCALKAVQYMAIGIPALVSPVGVNEKIVRDGIDGFHCKSISDFTTKLYEMASNDEMRLKMGQNALKRVHENYSVDVLTEIYEATFKEIAKTDD